MVNPIDLNDNKYGYIKTTCVDAIMAGCQWYRKDHTEFFSILNARLGDGDSGSAIYYNNQIFGVLSKSGTINGYKNYMSDLTLYVDAFVPFFNKVLYPYSPGKHITNGDSSTTQSLFLSKI